MQPTLEYSSQCDYSGLSGRHVGLFVTKMPRSAGWQRVFGLNLCGAYLDKVHCGLVVGLCVSVAIHHIGHCIR